MPAERDPLTWRRDGVPESHSTLLENGAPRKDRARLLAWAWARDAEYLVRAELDRAWRVRR